jgi:hypothetical protein
MKYLNKSFSVPLGMSRCIPGCKCLSCRREKEENERQKIGTNKKEGEKGLDNQPSNKDKRK